MKTPLALVLALAAVLPLPPSLGGTARAPRAAGPPTALVVGLQGAATASDAKGRSAPVRLFDKLSRGTTLRTGADSGVKLVFAKGERYALGASARAQVGESGLTGPSQAVTRLPRISPTLALSLIAPGDDPGERFPTLRIRTQEIAGVYPRGAVTLDPAAATLSFEAVSGAPTYKVQVTEQRSGDILYSLETLTTEIAIPKGMLKPGRSYRWSVETVGRIGPKAEGRGGFLTFTPEAEQARAALDRTLAGEPELDTLLLKIAVDLNLGRYREAYQGLQEAARRLPGDAGLAAAARAWGARLKGGEEAKATPPAPSPEAKSPTPSSSGGRSSW